MKKVFFIMLVVFNLVAICHTIGQENIYFNKRYFNNGIMGVNDMFENKSSIYALCYKNLSNGFSQIFHLKTDRNGEIISSISVISDTTHLYYSGSVNNGGFLNNSLYYVGSKRNPNEIINNEIVSKALIYKLDTNSNLIFIKEIEFINAYRSILYSIYIDTTENKLYCLGAKVIQTNDSTLNYRDVKTVFACLDTLGNIIWEREYGEYGYIPTVGLIKNKYGGFYIHGSVRNAALSNSKNEQYILNIDSLGNIIWERKWINDPNINQSISSMYPLSNGEAIITSAVYDANYYNAWTFTGFMNSQGIVYYYKPMFNKQGLILATRIFKHKDHFLCYVHHESTPNTQRNFCLYEFNENLDSLGCTFFDFQGRQHLYDMKQLPDGGFLFGGFMKDENNMNQAAWLMRIDSNLCANPMCTPLGIEEMLSEFKSENEIIVYPNPAQNIVTITTNSDTPNLLEIYTATGQLVYQENFQGQTQINVSTFTQGIYFVKLQSGHDAPVVKKLVVHIE